MSRAPAAQPEGEEDTEPWPHRGPLPGAGRFHPPARYPRRAPRGQMRKQRGMWVTHERPRENTPVPPSAVTGGLSEGPSAPQSAAHGGKWATASHLRHPVAVPCAGPAAGSAVLGSRCGNYRASQVLAEVCPCPRRGSRLERQRGRGWSRVPGRPSSGHCGDVQWVPLGSDFESVGRMGT